MDSMQRLLAQPSDPDRVLELITDLRPAVSAYSADPETGELPEESDEAELLAMASEMILRAGRGFDDEKLQEWSEWCSTLILDIAQQLDGMELQTVEIEGASLTGPCGDLTPLESKELVTQLNILRELEDSSQEGSGRVVALSTAMHQLFARAAQEVIAR
ncbi:hypothetical protein [Streptomyces sp. NPDC005435]|uniref:hypothetical protein n=1 Tax=Streptomyces sp. NPDC005435 TaxID=3154464 RepID=UPI0034570EE8